MKVKIRVRKKNLFLTTAEGVESLEVTLSETAEACEEMLALSRKLKRLKRGGEAYLDELPRVSVCATVLKTKTDSIEREIDEIVDTLSD